MKILLDECVPRKLKREFTDHEVHTVTEMGWAGKKNGDLLALMSGEFDVFLTSDRNLSYQQHLDDVPLALVVLSAVSNRLDDLKPLIPDVLKKLETVQPGELVEVSQEK